MPYLDLTNSFVYKGALLWKDLDALAENDLVLKDRGWQDGDKTVFFQASAPTGWTKDTTGALDGKSLRIVSGSGAATGGTHDISGSITLAHTHSVSNQAAHTHSVQHAHQVTTSVVTNSNQAAPLTNMGDSGGRIQTATGGGSSVKHLQDYTNDDSQASGSASSHDHSGTTGSQLSDVSLAYVNVILCSKAASSGYVDITTAFSYGLDLDDVYADFNDLGANDEFNRLRLIGATSVSIFGQAAAPVGWTKETAQNDKALRVVVGTGGGAGGSAGIGTAITLAHSGHSLSSAGSHTHSLPAHTHTLHQSASGNGGAGPDYVILYTGNLWEHSAGAGASSITPKKNLTDSVASNLDSEADHTHTFGSGLSDVTLAYTDVLQCSKDATPNAYTDMSAFFGDDNLLAWQDLDALANNDDYLNYHQIPATSSMFFYMSTAPSGWTKQTSVNDKLLRVVSGTGGSAGGSQSPSSAITLAHTHSISNVDHSHTVDAHSHIFADGTATTPVLTPTPNGLLITGGTDRRWGTVTVGGAISVNALTGGLATLESQTVATDSHSHGGATGSSLSNVTLAYADVIKCTKD
jgi:hypothetical protein